MSCTVEWALRGSRELLTPAAAILVTVEQGADQEPNIQVSFGQQPPLRVQLPSPERATIPSNLADHAPWNVPRQQDLSHYEIGAAAEAEAEAALVNGVPAGCYVALAPGDRMTLTDRLHYPLPCGQAIFLGATELIVRDHIHGMHTWRFALPDRPNPEGSPVLARLVECVVHRKPIGWKSLGLRVLVFMQKDGEVLARLNASDEMAGNHAYAWDFDPEALRKMCAAAKVDFSLETYESATGFLDTHPTWSPEVIEFEATNPREEVARELGLAIGFIVAIGFWGFGGFGVTVAEPQ